MTSSSSILDNLGLVAAERARRAADVALSAAVGVVKSFQARRFERSYADLLASERYRPAARFFLEELYGPQDFADRDAQFARVVPALVRLFPTDVVETVASLARLHAVSEQLDSAMAAEVGPLPLDAAAYRRAWQAVGRPEAREEQVALTLAIGGELDRLTRKPLLRQTLRLMRVPAHSAGLGALQGFLERGFDAFKSMRGAQDFLARVGANERALFAALFNPEGQDAAASLLGQLP